MNNILRNAMIAAGLVASTAALADVTLYQGEGFRGRAYTTDNSVRNLRSSGFDDFASSVVVRGGRWEICDDVRFEGRCVVLNPGEYPSLRSMGLNNRVSSLRSLEPVATRRDGYPPAPVVDYRRRSGETLYEAPVTSVRAVVGPPEQRCWVEREQVRSSSEPNVGGAIAGALIGGILGHQVGRGSGRDVATVGGAVAGAAIGSNAGTGGPGYYAQDVQRCTNVSSGPPQYWDVTYSFQGRDYRVQTQSPPGSTILVNGYGEPRV